MINDTIRWSVQDRYHHSIYLSQERWQHIIDPLNHPEMVDYEEHLQQTIQMGQRKQDNVNPQKYRYTQQFHDLVEDNTHIVAIVLFKPPDAANGKPVSNNYIVTAYQKEIG